MMKLARLSTSILRNLRPQAFGLGLILALTVFAQAQTFTVLHNFTGGQDGKTPNTGLTMDRAGNLYGTTSSGGYQSNSDCKDLGGCGVVFKLARGGSGWIFPRCTCSKEFSTTATDPYPIARSSSARTALCMEPRLTAVWATVAMTAAARCSN